MLNYYRKLTALRKSAEYRETFTYGHFLPAYDEEGNKIMGYYRTDEKHRILVLGNWGEETETLTLDGKILRVLLNNLPELPAEGKQLSLKSCQAVVLLMEA